MTCTWATTEAEFQALQPTWSKLFAENDAHGVFLSWEWASNWWKHFGAGRQLQVLCMTDAAGAPCLIAPFQVVERRVLGVGVSRDWLLLGAESVACSDHLGFLRGPGVGSAELKEAMDQVWARLGPHDQVWLTDLGGDPGTGPLWARRVATWARRAGLAVRAGAGPVCPLLKLPARWDDFVPALSRKFRTQLRRCLRKVEADERVSLHSLTEPDAVRQGVRDLVRLNRIRMGAKGIASSLGDAQMAAFLEDVTVDLVVAGRAWLDVMRAPEGVVAATLHLVHGDTVSSYQNGFDPAYKALWPTMALSGRAIERAIGAGHKWFDFLRGDEPYKYGWGALWTCGEEIAILPPGQNARLRHALPVAWGRLGGWARALAPKGGREAEWKPED